MADNIVKFYKKGAAEDPDAVLEQAVGTYEQVLILGWDKDGDLDVRASTNMDIQSCLWTTEVFKTKLMLGDYCE